MNSYLFYDLETTGLNHCFDQILQFAAIRTDASLREIQRHEFWIKLRQDVVPSPLGIIRNRISVSQALSGQDEYKVIRRIHELVNEPGTISIGYNTIAFDDLFLRFSFYRNLLPPYTHQYAQGCGRMDLLPTAVMFWLFKRHVLNWPHRDGKPSLRLEDLEAENQLAAGRAHDATVDVKATLELARRFLTEEEQWRYCEGAFNKNTDRNRIARLPYLERNGSRYFKGFMIHNQYRAQGYQAPVLYLGHRKSYPKRTLWLRLDSQELPEVTLETVADVRLVHKKLGEPGFVLSPEKWSELRVSEKQLLAAKENLRWLEKNSKILQAIADCHCNRTYPDNPGLDADAALYQRGFFSPAEKASCREFHVISPEQKAEIIERFDCLTMRELVIRVLGRNFEGALSGSRLAAFEGYMDKVNPPSDRDALVDYRENSKNNKRTTPLGALAEIQQLRAECRLDSVQKQLLADWETFIVGKWQRSSSQ